MKKLIITFKDGKEIERVEVEVPGPEPTEIDKIKTEIENIKGEIEKLKAGPK